MNAVIMLIRLFPNKAAWPILLLCFVVLFGSAPAIASMIDIGGEDSYASLHGCMVVNGGVKCWGNNKWGQLGDGTVKDSSIPVVAIPAYNGATAVATGVYHSCAVVHGSVRCWGNNDYGLGNGKTNSKIPQVIIKSGVTGISSGGTYSCAIVNAGVQCWGGLGVSPLSFDQSSTPKQIIPPNSKVSDLSIGNSSGKNNFSLVHACAVVDGGVKCWGANWKPWSSSASQLGKNGVPSATQLTQAIPAKSGVTAVSAGHYHTCAVVNGGVKCWGGNNDGQLGDSTTKDNSSPVQAIAANSNVKAVAAGGFHSCAVLNGGLKCWGNGKTLGIGSGYTGKQQVIKGGNGIIDVAAEYDGNCALNDKSIVQCGKTGNK